MKLMSAYNSDQGKKNIMEGLKSWRNRLVFACVLLVVSPLCPAWGAATYRSESGRLDLPALDVPGYGMFNVSLTAKDSTGQEFVLKDATRIDKGIGAVATFDIATRMIRVPYLTVYAADNTTAKYVGVDLEMEPGTDPPVFKIASVIAMQIGADDSAMQGPERSTDDDGAQEDTGPEGDIKAAAATADQRRQLPGPSDSSRIPAAILRISCMLYAYLDG